MGNKSKLDQLEDKLKILIMKFGDNTNNDSKDKEGEGDSSESDSSTEENHSKELLSDITKLKEKIAYLSKNLKNMKKGFLVQIVTII